MRLVKKFCHFITSGLALTFILRFYWRQSTIKPLDMNTIVKNLWPVSIIVIAATLAGFSLKPGAHSFQVFIDEKMVIDRYVDRSWSAPTVQIGEKDRKIE